jgi:hypothetical protein
MQLDKKSPSSPHERAKTANVNLSEREIAFTIFLSFFQLERIMKNPHRKLGILCIDDA